MEIWTEKYRPKKLKDMIGQDKITKRLEAFVKEKSLPHMLFAGPAGVGKTTASICMAMDLYGDNWKRNFLELNASDTRGIDIVRGRIKDFARTKPLNEDWKILFLDESDALTPEAQQALRRTMEKYTNTTRFILSANYSSKLIPPIQSRCAIFRFNPGEDKYIKKYLENIAKKEKLTIKKDGMESILKVAEGDFRKATNLLQSLAITSKKIGEKEVYEMAASLRPEEVKQILDLALKKRFIEARKKLSDLMINRGLSGIDVIRAIHREILFIDVPEKLKAKLIDKLGEYEFRIVEGGSEDLQIEAFLAQIAALEN